MNRNLLLFLGAALVLACGSANGKDWSTDFDGTGRGGSFRTSQAPSVPAPSCAACGKRGGGNPNCPSCGGGRAQGTGKGHASGTGQGGGAGQPVRGYTPAYSKDPRLQPLPFGSSQHIQPTPIKSWFDEPPPPLTVPGSLSASPLSYSAGSQPQGPMAKPPPPKNGGTAGAAGTGIIDPLDLKKYDPKGPKVNRASPPIPESLYLYRNKTLYEKTLLADYVYDATDHAYASDDASTEPPRLPYGWRTNGPLVHESVSFGGKFAAQNFINDKTREVVVAFKGTEFTNLGDWGTDIKNIYGFNTMQYTRAVEYATIVKKNLPEGYTLSFTGHSLGGGLAQVAAIATDRKAVTFNAANPGVAALQYASSKQGSMETAKTRDNMTNYVSTFDAAAVANKTLGSHRTVEVASQDWIGDIGWHFLGSQIEYWGSPIRK